MFWISSLAIFGVSLNRINVAGLATVSATHQFYLPAWTVIAKYLREALSDVAEPDDGEPVFHVLLALLSIPGSVQTQRPGGYACF